MSQIEVAEGSGVHVKQAATQKLKKLLQCGQHCKKPFCHPNRANPTYICRCLTCEGSR